MIFLWYVFKFLVILYLHSLFSYENRTYISEITKIMYKTITRPSGDIELLYVTDFFKMLWNGKIF